MKKLVCALTGICLASSVAGSAMAASAKFAATYDTDTVFAEAIYQGAATGLVAEVELATIHVAQWKEVLLGVSGQVNLTTFTKVKGNNAAGESTAKAEGTVRLGVLVVPEDDTTTCADAWITDELFAAPGPVTFASRMQELTVEVQLENAEDYVTIGLELDTTAAHHFNFVADDLDSGTYSIFACYNLTALAEANNVSNEAEAYAGIGPRILTVQEVRATKTGIIDESDPFVE